MRSIGCRRRETKVSTSSSSSGTSSSSTGGTSTNMGVTCRKYRIGTGNEQHSLSFDPPCSLASAACGGVLAQIHDHAHELRQRRRVHFLHRARAVNLNGPLAHAEGGRHDLVWLAARY